MVYLILLFDFSLDILVKLQFFYNVIFLTCPRTLFKQPVRLQTATSGAPGAISGMKVVTTPTMPTGTTTVRIQPPLPTVASVAATDPASTATTAVQLVPSNTSMVNATTTPAIRLATPVRQTLVKTVPLKTSTTPSAVRTSTAALITPKSTTVNAKNNFVSKSPMLAGIGKQQVPPSQSKSAAKDRERKSATSTISAAAAAAAAAASTSAAVSAGGYVYVYFLSLNRLLNLVCLSST